MSNIAFGYVLNICLNRRPTYLTSIRYCLVTKSPVKLISYKRYYHKNLSKNTTGVFTFEISRKRKCTVQNGTKGLKVNVDSV